MNVDRGNRSAAHDGLERMRQMSKAKGGLDKNLSNVVEDLNETPVNSHQAQQIQQDKNDRRHQDALNHDEPNTLNSTDVTDKGV